MPNLDDIQREYRKTIERQLPDKSSNYNGLNEEAKRMEAAVFRLFYCLDYGIELYDISHGGGPDFRIFQQGGGEEFYVEVTTLEKNALGNRTRIPYPPDYNKPNFLDSWGAFGADWGGILNKVDDKNYQLRNYTSLPIVLFIGTENPEHYIFEGTVLESIAAPWGVLCRIENYLNQKRSINYEELKPLFKPSIFFDMNFENGKLKLINKNISAIIFAPLNMNFMHLCGFIHPRPKNDFDHNVIPQIPFYKLIENIEGLKYSRKWVPREFDWDRFYYDCHFGQGADFSR